MIAWSALLSEFQVGIGKVNMKLKVCRYLYEASISTLIYLKNVSEISIIDTWCLNEINFSVYFPVCILLIYRYISK